MTLRGIINKHKNAKQGLKYLERKLAKTKFKDDDPAEKLLNERLEAKRDKVKYWGDAREKGRVPKAA